MEFMGCGHSANAVDASGGPVCVICVGMDPNAAIVVNAPDVTNRKAQCACKKTADSTDKLAFFAYRPDREYDSFYCGCRGWD